MRCFFAPRILPYANGRIPVDCIGNLFFFLVAFFRRNAYNDQVNDEYISFIRMALLLRSLHLHVD